MAIQPWEAAGQVSVVGQRSTRLVVRCVVRELSSASSTWQLRKPSGPDLVIITRYATALAVALAQGGHVAREVVVEARLFVTRLGDVETLGQVSLGVRADFETTSADEADVARMARQVARGRACWSDLRDPHLQVHMLAPLAPQIVASDNAASARRPQPARGSLRAVLERASAGLRRS